MYRLYSSSNLSLVRRMARVVTNQTRSASSKAGGGVAKVAGGSLLVTGLGLGGTVAFAELDPQFRSLVEDTVPGADLLLEMALGKKSPSVDPPAEPAPNKLKLSSPVVKTPAVEEKNAPTPTVEILPPPPAPPLDVPAPPLDVPAEEHQPVVAEVPPVQEVEVVVEEPVSVSDAEVVELKESPPVVADDVVEPVKVDEIDILTAPETGGTVMGAVESLLSTNDNIEADVDAQTNANVDISSPPVVQEAVEEQNEKETKAPDAPVVVLETETIAPSSEESKPPVETSSLDLSKTDATDIDNNSLETSLTEMSKEMKELVETAVTEYLAASDAVVNHMNIMQEVLEANITGKDEAVWNKMFEAAVAKSDATKLAEMKEKEAIASIENVIESIAAGRKNTATATNPELLVAEEAANRAIALLEKAKAKGAAIQSDARVMEEYRDLVEAGRQQFHKEMASIMPDVKLGEKSGKLSEEELNMFITHAYKKVLHLQQELAKQQTWEQERFKKALEKQMLEIQLIESEKVEEELSRQAKELEFEHERKIKLLREELEGDIRAQLRRQAAAHSDHLHDMLGVQEAELNRKHGHTLSEQLYNTNTKHLEDLSSLSGTVTGLTTSLQGRAQQDKDAVLAQQLWVACSGLEASLGTLKPIMGEVARVKTVASPGDSFVQIVLASLSPLALDRGVYTMENLKERFYHVEKTARRVACVGEGGSLLSYGLSYLQSVLTVDLSQRSPGEHEDKIDPKEVSPSDLITMAKHSLDRGNLARAVQYLTLLKGEPGRVVEDWLSEARLTIETRQAAEALVAHALVEGANCIDGISQ